MDKRLQGSGTNSSPRETESTKFSGTCDESKRDHESSSSALLEFSSRSIKTERDASDSSKATRSPHRKASSPVFSVVIPGNTGDCSSHSAAKAGLMKIVMYSSKHASRCLASHKVTPAPIGASREGNCSLESTNAGRELPSKNLRRAS